MHEDKTLSCKSGLITTLMETEFHRNRKFGRFDAVINVLRCYIYTLPSQAAFKGLFNIGTLLGQVMKSDFILWCVLGIQPLNLMDLVYFSFSSIFFSHNPPFLHLESHPDIRWVSGPGNAPEISNTQLTIQQASPSVSPPNSIKFFSPLLRQ